MKENGFFSADYAEARRKFFDANARCGGTIESCACPARGPEDETLHTDVAWIGSPDAGKVLVTLSATHGVEGFCGSGVQVGSLDAGFAEELPPDVALLQIHAINPHGFAWLRRVTEDNVDLNRNFVDHAAPYPENRGYAELAEAIAPREWNDAVIAETDRVFEAYAETHGAWALREAVSAGQYSHPGGIFYGGNRQTWSHDRLIEIFRGKLSGARQIAVIDYHTGLGPRGHGERICVHAPGSAALKQAQDWYEGDITSPALGTASSVEITGFNVQGMEAAVPQARVTAIALEYGTQPTDQVRLALRADNWLHLHGEPGSAKGRGIKRQIRDAFYQDQDDWREMVFSRAMETQRLAIRGLAAA